ncbi:magnesium transporter [Candidatus Woesearchaeota archaeon]|nr:magnesium transporter [Candidatus Woesearchaeota archaeon]
MKIAIKIIKESFKVLLLASLISSFGGIGLEGVQKSIIAIIPLLVLLPALNDMVGDFGTTFSSKLTTLLFLGKINPRNVLKSEDIKKIITTIYIVALICAAYISVLSIIIASLKSFDVTFLMFLKILVISLVVTSLIVSVIIIISVLVGIYVFKKNKDPNNFLIPLTTSISDLGSMLTLSILVRIMF